MFVGAMLATQADATNTSTLCYTAATNVGNMINTLCSGINPGGIINNLQQLTILIQMVGSVCNLSLLGVYLDSKLSNPNYTLGLFSLVISQTFSGIST